MKKRLTKIKKVCLAGLEPCSGHMLNGLMAAYTFVFYTLLSINSGLCRLVKVNFVLLKDTAFISSKPVPFRSMRRLLTYQRAKNADGQAAFQLCIVSK